MQINGSVVMEGMDIYMHDPTIRSLIGLIIAIISVYIIDNLS